MRVTSLSPRRPWGNTPALTLQCKHQQRLSLESSRSFNELITADRNERIVGLVSAGASAVCERSPSRGRRAFSFAAVPIMTHSDSLLHDACGGLTQKLF